MPLLQIAIFSGCVACLKMHTMIHYVCEDSRAPSFFCDLNSSITCTNFSTCALVDILLWSMVIIACGSGMV